MGSICGNLTDECISDIFRGERMALGVRRFGGRGSRPDPRKQQHTNSIEPGEDRFAGLRVFADMRWHL